MSNDSQPTIRLHATDLTDVGMVRDHNEDSCSIDPELTFFIVADGMGGHAAGEVASLMAVQEVSTALDASRDKLVTFAENPTDEDRRRVVAILENAVRTAHQAVFARGVKETDKQGMGTTLDVLLITGAEAFVAHVGDSRTYLLREGKAAQITTDHTVAEVLVIEGKLSAEEAQASPLRTILVNAIGVSADVGVEISHVRLRMSDRLLLCSDGLHDYFPADEEIAEHLLEGPVEEGLSNMVDIAKQRGGHDNITGIVVEVLELNAPPETTTSSQEAPTASDGIPNPVKRGDTLPVASAQKAALASTLPPGVETLSHAYREADTHAGSDHDGVRKTEPMPAVDPTADTGEFDLDALQGKNKLASKDDDGS